MTLTVFINVAVFLFLDYQGEIPFLFVGCFPDWAVYNGQHHGLVPDCGSSSSPHM